MRLRHLSALLLLVLCVNSVAQARVQLPADIDFVLSTLQTLSEQPPSVARSQEAQDLLATTLITSQYGTIDPEQNAEIGRRITAPMWDLLFDVWKNHGLLARYKYTKTLSNPNTDAFLHSHMRMSICFVRMPELCDQADFLEHKIVLNKSFGVTTHSVPGAVFVGEFRAFINNDLLLKRANFCQVLKSGSSHDKIIEFFATQTFISVEFIPSFFKQFEVPLYWEAIETIEQSCSPKFRTAFLEKQVKAAKHIISPNCQLDAQNRVICQ